MDTLFNYVTNVIVLLGMFLLIGVFYPTDAHRNIKLKSRWRNLAVFLLVSCMYLFIADIYGKQLLVDVMDAISYFILYGAIKVTSWHRFLKLQNKNLNFCLFLFFLVISIGLSMGEYKMGQPVKLFNRTYTVHQVEELNQIKDPNGTIIVPDQGSRFIQLHMSVKNEGSEAITIPVDEVVLRGSNEYKRDEKNEVLVNAAKQSLFYRINPDVTRTANVLFVVPNQVPVADLKVRVSKGDLRYDILFHGEVEEPISVSLVLIAFVCLTFSIIGMIFPVQWHRQLGLDTRMKNVYLFFASMVFLSLVVVFFE
jgi:hypothetical protein